MAARLRGADRVVVALLAAFPAVRLLQLLASGGMSPYPTVYPDTPTYRRHGTWLDFSLTSLDGRSVRPWGVTAWMALWPGDPGIVIAQVVLSTVAWATLALTVGPLVRRPLVRRLLVVAVLVLGCTAQVSSWDLVVLGESVSISSGVLALAALVRFTAAPTGRRAAVLLAFALWFTMTRPNVFVILLGWAVALIVLAVAPAGRRARRPPGVRPYAVVAAVLVVFSVYAYVYNVRSDVTWRQTLGYARTTVAYGYPVSANDPVARQVIASLRRSGAPACMVPSAPNVVSDHGTTAWVARTVRDCPQMDAWATAHWNRWWAGWLLSHPRATLRIIGTELPSSLSPPVWGPITSAVPTPVSALVFGSEPQPQSAVAKHSFRTQPLMLWLAAVLVLAALGRRRLTGPGSLRAPRWALAGTVAGGLGSAVSSGLLIQTAPFEVGQESAAAAVLITASVVTLTAWAVDRLLDPAYAAAVDHDAEYWDERYAERAGTRHEHSLSDGPDPTLVSVVSALPSGRALDVAAGLGRHALWLAEQGWRVTAVDFSRVAIDTGRAHEAHQAHQAQQPHEAPQEPGRSPIEWVVADAREWQPALGSAPYDLVLCSFFHLEDEVFARVRQWLAPGGRLVVLGHALRNLTDGVGGPTNPTYLHTEERLRAVAEGMEIERLEEVVRPTPVGEQIDLVLVARNP